MASPFIESLRAEMRLRGYSLRTEKTYIEWIKRYIYFIGKRHPAEAAPIEVKEFLTFLATEKNVAVNTPKIALNAVVFMYHKVMHGPIPVSTTQIYTHVLGQHYAGTSSPLDRMAGGIVTGH